MAQKKAAETGQPRPTLKTLAAETGLAIATVSRALSDAPDIGAATKARVREAARKLGYRPNRAGVRLRTGKTNVIALVLSAEVNVMSNTSALLYSIAETLRSTPYHLMVTPYFPDQDPLDPVKYLVETGAADGIIFNQTHAHDARVSYLMQAKIPFATHGRSDMGVQHPYFDFDNHAFGHCAVQTLAARGHKHIYALIPPRGHMYCEHMIAGMQEAAAQAGATIELCEGVTSDSASGTIEQAISARWQAAAAPRALISASTAATMAAVAALEGLGQITGRDFDIATKEAVPFMHRFRREIIVASEDFAEAGRGLARAIIDAIEGRDAQECQHLQVPQLSDFKTGH